MIFVFCTAIFQPAISETNIEAYTTPSGRVDNLALFGAAKVNDAAKVRFLLAAGANVNARANVTYGGMPADGNVTPLHVAADYGSNDVARILVEGGADLSATDIGGRTPLHIAVRSGDVELVTFLLGRGAGVNIADDNGDTALFYAFNARSNVTDIVRLLLDRGGNVNAANADKETPLIVAARYSGGHDLGVITILLARGANVNAQSNTGENALSIAIQRKYNFVSDLLLQNGAIYRDLPSYRDIDRAVYDGDAEKLRELIVKTRDRSLINWTNRNGAGLLWSAAAQNRPEIVRILLENGADPNIKTNDGETPLHQAAAKESTASTEEKMHAVEIATMLLEKGIDVNARTTRGVSALDFAEANHQNEMTALLIKHGAR